MNRRDHDEWLIVAGVLLLPIGLALLLRVWL